MEYIFILGYLYNFSYIIFSESQDLLFNLQVLREFFTMKIYGLIFVIF